MKQCDECGERPANIHLTQIMQNETLVSHLCEECARKKGINISINEESAETSSDNNKSLPDIKCKHCGYTYAQFRAKGWLGCSDCYYAFEKEIDEIFMQMHGSLIHKGKKYLGSSPISPQSLDVEMKRLRQELAVAIKNEAFEQAATIRDAIRMIKQMGRQ